jgi:hypothetical protein
MEYRGFIIKRLDEHVLFYIETKEGMHLPAMLGGLFTKLTNLHSQIDEYLTKYPDMTAEKLFVEKPTSVPRHKELG